MNPLPRSGTPVFRFTRFLVAVVAALLIVPLAVHAQSVPNAPTGLTATPGDGQVTLSWDDPGDTTITGYQASSDDGTSYSVIGGSDANTISHTVDDLTNGTEYTFKVRAVNEAGTGAASAAVNETPLIAAPKNLGVTVGDGQVTLGWDDPDNSSIGGYEVSSDGGTSYSEISGSDLIIDNDANTISHTVTGLTNGTSYTFAVRAVNGAAAFVPATPMATSEAVPAAPSKLQASAGDGQATLSWDDPDDTTITGYQVSSDDGTSYSAISGSDANTISHTVDDLTNGTEYSFKVRAVNEAGTGAPATVTATPLIAAPRNLGVTVGDGQVELRWADPDNDSIDSYEVSSNGGTSYSPISDSDDETTDYTVTGLTNGTSYSFAVRAVNGAAATVSATPTVTSVAVPAAPTDLTAEAGDTQATLSWTNPNNNSISFYQVSSDGGTNYDPIEESDAATTSHTVGELTGGAEYSFAVRAVNEKGTGAAATKTETPLFAAPTNLGAAVGDGQVTLGWDDPDNDNISGYEVSSNGGTSYSAIGGSGASTTRHTVTGLTNDMSYSFKVRAVNDSVTGVAATVSATPTVTSVAVPAAPSNLQASAGDTQATLSWDDAGDTTITGYQVSSDDGRNYSAISGSDANTISHTVTGLTNGTEYSFKVRAVNEAGTGAPATVTATPLFAAPKKLGSAAGDGQVTLRWDDPGDTTITGYEVSSEAGLWGYSVISGSGASTTSHTVTGLTNDTDYDYTFAVRAVNGAAAFVWATPTVTSVAVPAAPSNLTATAGGGQVTLSWVAPQNDDISGYQYSQDGGTRFRVAYRSDEDTTSHVAKGLTGGTEYSFLVRAVNEAGTGAWSDPAVSATPKFKAPKNLGAEVGDGQVTLSWVDPDPSNDNISFYQVSSNGGTSYSAISNSDANTISHTVTGLTNGTEYSFKVRAVNASVSVIGVEATVSATPTTETSVAVPAAPSNLRVTNGNGQATLYWNNPPNDADISFYELSSDGGTTYSEISGSDEDTTSHTVTGLTNWTSYYFVLRAVNDAGTGAPATLPPRYPGDAHPGYAHPGYAPTAQPGSFTANPLHERVELSWTAPDDIEETPINGYKLRKKRRDKSEWGSEYTFVFSYTTEYDLDNEKTYDYKLRTFNDFGFGPYITLSTKPVPKKPEQPTGLTVVAGDGEVALTWDAPDDRHENIDYYRLSRYVGDPIPRSISGDVVEKLRWNEKTIYYTQQYLTNGKEYEISLLAENSAGDSDPSVRAAAVTPLFKAPSNLQASPGYGEVALSWTNAVMTWESLRNSTFSGFDVSSDGGTSYSTIEGSDEKSFYGWNDSIATTNSHTVENLTGGTEYSFAVRAVNGKSTGLVITTPRFAAPTNLGFTVGDGQVTLRWDDPENDNISRYQVSIDGGTSYSTIGGSDVIIDSDANTISHTVTGLTNGTTYSFAVRAVNDSLIGAAATVSATPTVTNVELPDAPTELTATPGDGQVALSWVGPSNSSISFYQVSSDGGTSFPDINGSNANTTSHTVTGLTNGRSYSFGVRAVNEAGTGAPATVTATPLIAAPTNLGAAVGDGQVTLGWDDPGNSSISGCQLSIDGGEFDDISGSGASTTSHTVTGLTNGTAYTFAVRAVNGAAATVSATPTVTNVAVPDAPTELTATPGDGQVALSWVGPSNSSIDSYEVSSDGGTSYSTIIGSDVIIDSDANTISHTVTGLINGRSYSFGVRAVNEAGTGAPATVTATPMFAAPTNLVAFPNSGQVDLEWDTNDKVTDYMVDTKVTGADVIYASSLISVRSEPTTTATILALTNGTQYTFRVVVVRVVAVQSSLEISEPSSVSATPVNDAEVEEQLEFEVSFLQAAYEAREGGDPVRVTVKLSNSAAGPLKIPIRVTPQGRTVPADYAVEGLVDGKLAFEVDDDTQSFTIKATEQAEQDDNFHDVRVALGFGDLPEGVTEGEPGTATVTIIDAEGAVVRARFRRLNDESLSKHALTIADVTNRAIGARMDDPRGKRAAAWTLAGGSTIHDALHAKAQALEDGTLSLDDVLAGSSFRLPLGAANDDMAGGGPVLWGRGDRQVLESTDSAFAWNGTVLTGQLGIDTRLRDDLLAGLALSRSIGEFDYTDGTGPTPAGGDYGSQMTSVHPYLGWLSPQGLTLWATVGYGRGEIEIEDAQVRDGDPDYPVRRSDTTLKTAAASASGPLMTDESLIAGGTTTLMLKGEASVAQVEVAGNDDLIEKQTVNANRLRLALEGSHEQTLASGSSLTPSLELGLRRDGGDGITGGGIEIGGGLRYRDPARGLTIEGNGRVLAGQSDYREWGLGGSLRLDPGTGGQGLSFSLTPAWGDTASGVDRLWDQDVAALATDDTAVNDNVPQMRLDGELGYGFGTFGGHGLLTPYGGFALAEEGSRRYRIGIRFEIAPAFDLSFEGARREPANDAAAEHGVMLRMQGSW